MEQKDKRKKNGKKEIISSDRRRNIVFRCFWRVRKELQTETKKMKQRGREEINPRKNKHLFKNLFIVYYT